MTQWDDDEEGNESYFLEVDTIDFLNENVNDFIDDHLYLSAAKIVISVKKD